MPGQHVLEESADEDAGVEADVSRAAGPQRAVTLARPAATSARRAFSAGWANSTARVAAREPRDAHAETARW